MANSYIPRADARARMWMESFARQISLDPGRFMLAPAQAASIQSVVDSFVAKLLIAKAPGTRTRGTVIEKDNARFTAEQLIQQYYSLIKCNAGVSDDDKIAIGVRPLNRTRTRVNAPTTSPKLNILGCTPGVQSLRYSDSFTPNSPAKPFGAAFLELHLAITDGPVGKLDAARSAGMFTRNPIRMEFTQADDRKKATYYARWVSRRGDTGPWSLPVSMSIAA